MEEIFPKNKKKQNMHFYAQKMFKTSFVEALNVTVSHSDIFMTVQK